LTLQEGIAVGAKVDPPESADPAPLFEQDDVPPALQKMLTEAGWSRMALRARNSRILIRTDPRGQGEQYACADCVRLQAGGAYVVGELEDVRRHRHDNHRRGLDSETEQAEAPVHPMLADALQLSVGDVLAMARHQANWETQATQLEADVAFWKDKYEAVHREQLSLVRALNRLPWLEVRLVEEK
jgi:hypothetical protein